MTSIPECPNHNTPMVSQPYGYHCAFCGCAIHKEIVTAEIESISPQRDFLYAQYDSQILTNADKLFELSELGYNPVKYELLRNYRRGGRYWVGVYEITFEKAVS